MHIYWRTLCAGTSGKKWQADLLRKSEKCGARCAPVQAGKKRQAEIVPISLCKNVCFLLTNRVDALYNASVALEE